MFSNWPIGVVLVIVAGLVAVVIFAVATGYPLRYPDEKQYLEIARSIANGGGFAKGGEATAYRPPVWPLLISAFVSIGLPVQAVLVFNALLLAAAALFAGYIGIRISGNRWGSLAAVAVLLYPLNFYTAGTLYPQAFCTTLLVLLFLTVDHSMESDGTHLSGRTASATGVVAAAVALAVPTLLLVVVGMLAVLMFTQKTARVKVASCLVIFFLLPIAIWTARNEVVMDAFVPLSTTSGENLYIGNSPSTTPSSGTAVDYPPAAQPGNGLSEVERDKFFRGVAVRWIDENPKDAAILYVKKVVSYFAPYNTPVTAGSGSSLQELIAYISYAAIVLGTVARIALYKVIRLRRSEIALLSLYLANALFAAVFFTRVRFRQPLDFILLIETSVALAAVIILFQKRGHVFPKPDDRRQSPEVDSVIN